MVLVNRIDNEFWQMRVFDPSGNACIELLCFDLSSLIAQSKEIYNIDIRTNLN
jgi:hypothetical protein